MQTAEIRRRFLAHFEARGHTVVPSASLVADDPTLLLVNAGMVPFKPYFLGDLPAPYPRATSVQKVVRTVDIENVGRTARHASFFQMCGNFSFGDYFKAGAIPLAWELLTTSVDDGGFGFAPESLWATVYLDDDEAFELWKQHLPEGRIQRRGMEDNYWSMGVPGPCGPCSEIYYDRGPEYGAEGGPIADEDRYLEVWNLVFMQYERGPVPPGGGPYDYPILRDLPSQNIDTGMGLERMATILQGVDNLYEIDISRPVLDRAAELTGTCYGVDEATDVRLRVVADHTRTAAMLVADGVTPSNEGRGYVLRRLLRRAVSSLRVLGARQPMVPELLTVIRRVMGPIYPELNAEVVGSILAGEEESFLRTLTRGLNLFDGAVADVRGRGSVTLPGDQAFELHDTFGFPIDLTLELAREQGLTVDEDGFRRLMQQQRDAAKSDRAGKTIGNVDLSAYRPVLERSGATTFTGYTELARESVATALLDLRNGTMLPAAGEGDEVGLVLDTTPFYAEAGGQEADTGAVSFDGGEARVLDVQRPVPDLVVHRVRVLSGELKAGDAVHATVDVSRRRAVSRAHTATHLVHRAFRGALGETATQAGSLNAPGRLRFDFHAPQGVPASVLRDVEDEVNEVALRDLEVSAFVTTLDEARSLGATALFGEKYGNAVRVVDVGDRDAPYARELCGGTHVGRSAQLGAVTLLSESSSAAGVRRVEALVGIDAFRFLAREHVLLGQVASAVKATQAEEVPERVADVVARLREAERSLERLRGEAVLANAGGLVDGAQDVNGIAVVATEAPAGTAAADVRKLALDIRGRMMDRPAVVAVLARAEGSVPVVVATTEGARDRGIRAGDLVKVAAAAVGGRGGGKPDLAQGGGSDPDGIPAALAAVRDAVAGGAR
ncbi:MAG: alanyl-tRNA synthetase [Frankiaceae bacterium]|jgi:alanyl-tRNA synthetase|nr:alanyl-tRNA synthetase [Frankiaceae bacterium]